MSLLKNFPVLHQMDTGEHLETEREKLQKRCIHQYASYQIMDFSHDRLIEVAVCEKCNRES